MSSLVTPIEIKGRHVSPQKAIVSPLFNDKTVLTNSPWRFVNLWLRRNGQQMALFYWEQAEHFHNASRGLLLQSAPLLLYYSYMNAVKALLISKGIHFKEHHGVSGDRATNRKKIDLATETVKIKNDGVLPSLSQYYGEQELSKVHTVKDILFNLSFVHRTYCLTYASQTEMFLPLKDSRFAYDKRAKAVFFHANVDKNILYQKISKRIPGRFDLARSGRSLSISSKATIAWPKKKPAVIAINALTKLHADLRTDLVYINGSYTLWYLKMNTSGAKMIDRRHLTLILAAMHKLSELCRYRPMELASYLEGQKNWLLAEFISMASDQFLDEIAAEITGHQFLVPNVRTPVI